MSAPHVLVDAVVLMDPMGGALRYAIETLPRCARLLHEQGGRLSVLLAGDQTDQAWTRPLSDAEHLHLHFVQGPMRPALRRALRETHAVQKWIDSSAAAGFPVHLVQTQSLPIPRLRFDGRQIHLSHGLRRQQTGPAFVRHFANALLGKGVRELHSLLAVSESLASELNARFPDLPVQVAAPACDHRPALPRNPEAEAFVLCPGPIVPHKNHGLLLEAWDLDKSLPPLRLYAKLDSDARLLRDRAARLGLAQRIAWHAPLDESTWPEALATCAAVVLPSRLESFGMVALESLHAGAPLALSDLPAHGEVVGDAKEAVTFFPPNNPQQAADAVAKAIKLNDPESTATRLDRAAQFSWQMTAKLIVEHWIQAFRA
ncbi:MAG: glycosyltransferase [Planctomycetes bacterium]|nr:glycosyltransferase [Planctomycetota bacterium]